MPKSKSRRRRNASRTLAPASQSLMQDLSVEVQGDKIVPVPEVVDRQTSSKEPLVEITAAPQTKEPIVRVGRLRHPPILEITAAETILAEAEQRQARSKPADIEDEPEVPATVPCNRDMPGSDQPTIVETAKESAQSFRPEETTAEKSEALTTVPVAANSKSALLQQTAEKVKQASSGLLTAAHGMLTPMTAKFAELRAKRQSASLEKKTKDKATRNALESTEAKGDLKRIASSLEARSSDGGPGNSDGPSSKAKQLLAQAENAIRPFWERFRGMLARNGINSFRDVGDKIAASMSDLAAVAYAIRLGVGTLFVIGGWNKLSKLLSPANSDAIVASYTSTTGYINEFFMGYLFGAGSMLTPWSFLTALSAFELVTGFMLLAGLLVRPVALVYAFLLWTFVVSLPVVTTNGINPGVNTYMAPALLVQIRDVALSGIMFALFGLGSGIRSLDIRIFGQDAAKSVISWDVAGVLLRLSTAVVFIVGGAFAGMPNIKTFMEPGMILLAIGLVLLWGGRPARYAAAAACAVLFIYMMSKIGIDKGLLGSLNAIKRELALFAATFVISARGCGELWTAPDIARRLREGVSAAMANLGQSAGRTEKATA
ncbi:MAG: DoxX family membrane protein [Pseudomonadota bacterium]